MVAQKGFDVACYEKKAKEDVAYDWTDDVNPAAFAEAGMEMPPENIWHKKLDWSFVPPYKNTITKLKGPRYLQMAEGYITKLALDKNNEIIGYEFVNMGKMMEAIKGGMSADEALKTNLKTYGRYKEAVKYIDPRKD